MTKRVLTVGHCSFDHGNLTELITANFDAEVVAVASRDETLEKLAEDRFDLVLVNRILLGDSSEGVDLIEQVKSDPASAGTPFMLLSNFAEAQRAAVAIGAEAGFGKSELSSTTTLDKLARCLGQIASQLDKID